MTGEIRFSSLHPTLNHDCEHPSLLITVLHFDVRGFFLPNMSSMYRIRRLMGKRVNNGFAIALFSRTFLHHLFFEMLFVYSHQHFLFLSNFPIFSFLFALRFVCDRILKNFANTLYRATKSNNSPAAPAWLLQQHIAIRPISIVPFAVGHLRKSSEPPRSDFSLGTSQLPTMSTPDA